MSRDTIRARNARPPSCRKCGFWSDDPVHLPVNECPEVFSCSQPDEHHVYDGPEAAVWDEETAALLAVADAADKMTDEHYLLHTEWGECRYCRRDDGHDEECVIGALLVSLAALEALP